MGNLIAFGFGRSWAAREVLTALRAETAVEEAFVVERAPCGRCVITNASNITALATADSSRGGLWGAMVRLIFLNSSLDLVIPRGSSALFLLLKNVTENRVLRAIKPYRPRILKTSLPREAEQRLRSELVRAA
jgi:uncharacterized membrane protein